jgi:hypothetical protein
MNGEQMLVQELQRLDRLDREAQLDLDDELEGEDTGMELELLASRVRAARLAGA